MVSVLNGEFVKPHIHCLFCLDHEVTENHWSFPILVCKIHSDTRKYYFSETLDILERGNIGPNLQGSSPSNNLTLQKSELSLMSQKVRKASRVRQHNWTCYQFCFLSHGHITFIVQVVSGGIRTFVGIYKVGTVVIAPIRSHCLCEHVGS